jgi:hypothetical protein
MKLGILSYFALALFTASSEAFAPVPSPSPSTELRAEIGETGVAFENVAREWRCKVRHVALCWAASCVAFESRI